MTPKETKCEEHELFLVDENWMGKNSVMVILECQKCKSKFRGLMIEDG